VDLSGAVGVGVRLKEIPCVRADGANIANRCVAPQPVLTRYKLLEIERVEMSASQFTLDTTAQRGDNR
ncbi:MAG TPA: hypothetical protein VKK81_04260, partial [Candidatus Binatia bacterium]|nr:hypothetical protein [Candidatus Binatia bacterium]